MAPKHARCHQTQRLRLFPGDHVVFETSQMMTGIPMADLFKVEARWDITPSPQDTSRCEVSFALKSIPLRKIYSPLALIDLLVIALQNLYSMQLGASKLRGSQFILMDDNAVLRACGCRI